MLKKTNLWVGIERKCKHFSPDILVRLAHYMEQLLDGDIQDIFNDLIVANNMLWASGP